MSCVGRNLHRKVDEPRRCEAASEDKMGLILGGRINDQGVSRDNASRNNADIFITWRPRGRPIMRKETGYGASSEGSQAIESQRLYCPLQTTTTSFLSRLFFGFLISYKHC